MSADIAREHLDRMRTKQDQSGVAGPDFTKRIAWFTVDATDRLTGKQYNGKFLSKIPSINQRGEIAALAAALANHTPWEAMPPIARTRFEMLATFAVVLQKRPTWFDAPGEFLSAAIPEAVYEQILNHFDTFFRPRPDTGGSSVEDAHTDGADSTP